MESMPRFRMNLCLLMCALFIFNVLGNIQFSRYIPLNNYTCSSANTLFEKVYAAGRLTCAMIGALNDQCFGVYFDSVKMECTGCMADFDDRPKVLKGTEYFARNSTYHMMKYANDRYNNKRCDQSTSVFHAFSITSYQHCAKVCGTNADCYSFFYQPRTQECLGCQYEYGVLNINMGLEEWTGSMYFGKFRYLGCFYNKPRILENNHTWDDYMTTELCVGLCMKDGYLYALTESTHWCECGNELSPNDQLPSEECSYTCAGNTNQNCGAGWTGSLYTLQYWY